MGASGSALASAVASGSVSASTSAVASLPPAAVQFIYVVPDTLESSLYAAYKSQLQQLTLRTSDSMLQISQLDIAPGQSVRLRAVTWRQYKKILEDLSPHRATRLAYNNGQLLIMRPNTKQESDKEIISDLVKALLEELQIEFRSLGSTTFERRSDLKAIEPAQCFYIQNEKLIRAHHQIDIRKDSAPDLVLEICEDTQNHLDIYAALGVPELWQFNQSELSIHELWAGIYKPVEESTFFPELPIKDLLPYCLEQSRTLGRNIVMRDFRKWVRDTKDRQSQSAS